MDVSICLNPHRLLSNNRIRGYAATRHRQPPSSSFMVYEGGLDQETLRPEHKTAVSSIMERHTLSLSSNVAS